MSTDIAYPHVVKPPGEPARLRRNARVRVAQIVMDYLGHGWSVEEVCRQHPHLSAAEAHAAMAYYFDHQDEIDAEIAAEDEAVRNAVANAPETPLVLRLKAKGLL